MREAVVALGDLGATNENLVIMNLRGQTLGHTSSNTDNRNYDGTMDRVADDWLRLANGYEIVAASLAIAASPDEHGFLVQAGDLTPFVGRNPGADLGDRLGRPVGVANDTVVIAISEDYCSEKNGGRVNGISTVHSSGFNDALRTEKGVFFGDEGGHEELRDGSTCTCGKPNHIEAYISGKGLSKNHEGVDAEELLLNPDVAEQLTVDITEAMLLTLERHKQTKDFVPDVWTWTGGLALGQPFIMLDAAERLQDRLGKSRPLKFGAATMGMRAGLHGTFVIATNEAKAA